MSLSVRSRRSGLHPAYPRSPHEQEPIDRSSSARERFYGRFTRSFTLPEGADLNAVQAHLASGVLTIVFPKVPSVQPKKIPVTVEKVAKV
jgi:HSP20 family protein